MGWCMNDPEETVARALIAILFDQASTEKRAEMLSILNSIIEQAEPETVTDGRDG